jgi:predicted dehydrogenase
MNKSYGVGIIGLTPPGSWAAIAHVPALQSMSGKFHIAGVANSSARSARAAASAFGIERAFDSVEELLASDEVDIALVSVKAPRHHPLVKAALRAGKHIYCEWPLGNGFEETKELAQLASAAGVKTVCGAQAVVSPVVRYARDLIREGYVGELLTATVVADGGSWGPVIPDSSAYILDAANGATMLTVPLGHSIAAFVEVLGAIQDVSALVATRRRSVRLADSGEDVALKAPDQVIAAVRFQSGLPMSLHYRGGLSKGQGFRWEIIGTTGELEILGDMGAIEMIDLSIKGVRDGGETREILEVPEPYTDGPHLGIIPDNVARLYNSFYEDLQTGTTTVPSFEDAVRHHRVLAAIEKSAESRGCRVDVASHHGC